MLDFGEQRLQRWLAAGQPVLIPRGGRERRQRELIRQVDAGIEARHPDPIGVVEVQDRRQQDDAIEVDVVMGLEGVDEHR
jgi:hypothetical protein